MLSPFGGVNLSGSQTVTITSTQPNTTIYYTLDGSYPGKTSPIYSGPLSLDLSGAGQVHLQARALDVTTNQFGELASGFYRGHAFKAGEQWYAAEGEQGAVMTANEGGPIFVGGRYYVAGQYYAGGTNGNLPPDAFLRYGIRMYSSADLLNWRYEGQILRASPDIGQSRAHIVFNASTSKYVLWDSCFPTADAGNSSGAACIATADSITGPWTWVVSDYAVDGHGFKDDYLFEDDDGTAYAIYTDGAQSNIYITKLSSDYLSVFGSNVVACSACGQESPVLFKRNGVYFLVHGTPNQTNYHDSINPVYQTATAPLGTWSTSTALYASDPVNTFFNAQPSAVFKVNGTTDGWVLLGDLWIPKTENVYDTTHVMVPLTFADDTHVRATTPSTWALSDLH